VSTGKVIHAFANNPLEIHPNARRAAFAAACAGVQGKYWEARDVLFTQKPRTESEIVSVTSTLVDDRPRFEVCAQTEPDEINKQIASDIKYAQKFGLTGTPSFGIGLLRPDGNVAIRKFVVGAQPFGLFQEILDQMLRDAENLQG